MTIVYSQNFDALSPPALPANWTTADSSVWFTSTTAFVSSPNGLVAPADGKQIICTAFTAIADMDLRYDVSVVAGQAFVSPFVRYSADQSNGYLIIPNNSATLNSQWNFFKRAGGSFSQINTFNVSGLTGTQFSVRMRVQGSTIYFKIWNYGSSEPGTWNFTTTDTSITGVGYVGFYSNIDSGFTGVQAAADNVVVDNLVSSGLTAGTSSSSGIGTTSATVTNTGASGGVPTYTYQWYRSTTSGFTPGSGNIVSGATALTLNDTGLTPSTTYYYVNVVTDSTSATAASAQISLTTQAAAALANGTLSASSVATTTATLIDSGATGGTSPYAYQWYRSTTSGFTPGGGNIVSGATSVVLNDTGLTASTTYYYKNIVTDHVGATATSSQLSITTTSGPNVLPVTNSAFFWEGFDLLTTGTFGVSQPTMQATANGSYLKFNATNTSSIALGIDNATNSTFPSGDMPIVRYSINSAAFVDVQLAPSQTSLVLSNSLSTGTIYSIEVYFKANSSGNGYGDVWGSSGVSPTNVLRINSVTVDSGGTVAVPTLLPLRGVIAGDSITAGQHVNSDGSDDATGSFAQSLARALNMEFVQQGYGGTGWTVAGGSNAPPFPTSWNYYSYGRPRSLSNLDFYAVVQGVNDARSSVGGSTIQAAVQSWLTAARAALGSTTKILIIVPSSGSYESNLSAAVTAYKTSSGDTNVYFIDATALFPAGVITTSFASGPFEWTYDGVHPLIYGHSRIAAAYAAKIEAVLGGGSTVTGLRQIQISGGGMTA